MAPSLPTSVILRAYTGKANSALDSDTIYKIRGTDPTTGPIQYSWTGAKQTFPCSRCEAAAALGSGPGSNQCTTKMAEVTTGCGQTFPDAASSVDEWVH